MKTVLILLMITLMPHSSQAINRFYEDKERGWYYFEDNKKEEPKKEKKTKQTVDLSAKSDDEVLEILAEVQKKMQSKQARYVLQPTVENARDFMIYQQKMFANGTDASKSMQTVLLKYPELDPRIENPMSEQGARLKHTEQNSIDEQKIKEFAKHFKLYYFFKSHCNYCQAFLPVIERVVGEYNFKVEVISLDQNSNAQEKLLDVAIRRDDNLANKLQVQTTPTIMAYNAAHNIYVPISRGFLPEHDLKLNILHVYDHLVNLSMEAK